jgi:TolB-like protein
MKKITVTAIAVYTVFALTACATTKASQTVTLDEAIQEAAQNIENTVQAGQKIAVLNFTSPTEQFSAYVIDELSIQLANGRKVVVVDRRELDLIRQEERFQLSGEVSDESALSIGKKLGAQFIVSGSLNAMGNAYRFRVRVLNVENAVVEVGSTADLSTGETKVAFMLSDTRPVAVSVERPAVQPPVPVRTYNIGDTGPAGGIIFYDRGENSGIWRYLEAAPARTEFNAEWGAYGQNVVGTETAVGSGKRNTQIIVDQLHQLGETGKAAQLCASLNYNGFTDWFLPSKDELDLMYKNLKQKSFGNFGNNWYWSSSQDRHGNTWSQTFSNGRPDYHNLKIYIYPVRAVRAF